MRTLTALLMPVVAAASLLLAPAAANADPSTTWAAISVGNNGYASAIATGHPTWQSAAKAANAECGYRDCGWSSYWPSTKCGASARSARGIWYSAWGDSLGEARQIARQRAGSGATDGLAGCADIIR
ncbi:DUF4189 domain-containing protein [Nocardia sp. NPDC058658]|uniref:DUF4189 domain-containing protein n=1 Tax=Nocardia sp. NPDC058658 TaxID=3346580 RepID=UPI003661B2FA